MPFNDLEQYITDRWINEGVHPDNPELKIYNYTQNTQFKDHWDDVTESCRGLIVEDGQIIARGPRKFFNLGQTKYKTSDIVSVFEKVDGSLVIPYLQNGIVYFATRGSFTSEQAKVATNILHEYDEFFQNAIIEILEEGRTPIFEIIYPENKIVVNYGDRRELIYIGTVDNKNGLIDFYSDRQLFSDFVYLIKEYKNDQLTIPENSEGFVVQMNNNVCAKIKSDWYLKIHKLVTNKDLYRTTLISMIDEDMEWISEVPDEFYNEIQVYQRNIEAEVDVITEKIILSLQEIKTCLFEDKDIAIAIQKNEKEIRDLMFIFWRKGHKDLRKHVLRNMLNHYREEQKAA